MPGFFVRQWSPGYLKQGKMEAICLLHLEHNYRKALKLQLQALFRQFTGVKDQLEGSEANVMFRQNCGFHGKKPLIQRSMEQSITVTPLPMRTFCTAEVYHPLR